MSRQVWAGVAALVTAVLALTWVAWPRAARAVTLYTGTEHYAITVTVHNPRVGATALDVATDNREHPDHPESEAITVELIMPLMGHALMPSPETTSGTKPGHTRFEGVMLSMAGPWEVVVTVTPPSRDAPHERATVPLWIGGG